MHQMNRLALGLLVALSAACGTLELNVGVRRTMIGDFELSLTYDPGSQRVVVVVPAGQAGATLTFQPVDDDGNPVGDPITVTPPEEVDLPPGATGVEAVAENEGDESGEERLPFGGGAHKLRKARLSWSGFWEFPLDLSTSTSGRWYTHIETLGVRRQECRALFDAFKSNRVSAPLLAPSIGTVDVAFLVFVQTTPTGDVLMTFYDDRPFVELTVDLTMNGSTTTHDLLQTSGSLFNGWHSRSLTVPLAQAGQPGPNRLEWSASVRSKGQRVPTGPVGYVDFTLP